MGVCLVLLDGYRLSFRHVFASLHDSDTVFRNSSI